MRDNGCLLNIYETTAYWWIRTIKYKLRDLDKNLSEDKKEIDFLNTFYNLSDDDYRDLYLRLSTLTKEEVSKYLESARFSNDFFMQSTKKRGHDVLNDDLGSILAVPIKDIKLTPKGEKNINIMTSDFNVWTGNNKGYIGLCRLFENDYILNGDKKFKDFYYLVLAYLDQVGENVDYSVLRKSFVDSYHGRCDNSLSMDELYYYFNYMVRVARDNKLLIPDDKVCHLDICNLDKKTFDYKIDEASDLAKKLLRNK